MGSMSDACGTLEGQVVQEHVSANAKAKAHSTSWGEFAQGLGPGSSVPRKEMENINNIPDNKFPDIHETILLFNNTLKAFSIQVCLERINQCCSV